MGITKVNPGRLRVAMNELLTMSECGKSKGIVCMVNEAQ